MNKQISIILVSLLMLLSTTLVVNAQVIASEVEIRGTVSQFQGDANDTNFSVNKWDAMNFAGFWYDIDGNKQTESLEIVKFKDSRTIDKDNLVYKTTRIAKKHSVFSNKKLNVENSLDANMSKASPGGYYAIVGWMAEKYVAVNGKNNKLAKLIYSKSDKYTLKIGETWDIGEGYSLMAQSIDAKATPRQAWIVFSKNGTKLDDKVIMQGDAYTYSMKSLAGETDVPIFVTYADSIFSGATSDMVQLRYTWLMSDKVIEIKAGDKFNILEVDTIEPLTLMNSVLLTLTADSTIDIAGNMKFKVADSNDDDVRFYPKIDYKLESTTPATPVTPTVTMTPVTPTVTVTSAITATNSQTPIVTQATTQVTKQVTPVETKKGTPGFETGIAIAGLVIVAYIVLRQKR